MDKPFFVSAPVLFSQMGGVKNLPPETAECYKAGFDSGADAACANIQLTKDGVPVVISQGQLEKLCGVKESISQLTFAEFKSLDAGYNFIDDSGNSLRDRGFKFMSLRELLESFPDKKFNINLVDKSDYLVQKYAQLVIELGAQERILTSSIYGNIIKLVRQLLPGTATAFSFMGLIGVYGLFRSGLLYFVRNFEADALLTPEAIGVSYIANSGLIREMHKRGIGVYVWNISNEKQYRRIVEAGADGYMTDDIPLLKSYR
ncbi:MAG TPA: glycerophosphodiester phosphodiesterase family protein [Spirochaetota bacterium]|nr:glycerophosphodiester phosphodiesterase family protein [Spirochaetota bacterium]